MSARSLRYMLRVAATSFLLGHALQAGADPSGPGLFRAYLSLSGNDANPCTLQAPCRLLPAALAAVADGGEVWMLDSANYNTGLVSITKSVTILAIPGELGSVVGVLGPAISISTPGVTVILRNLNILSFNLGTVGANVFSAAKLSVQNCVISGFNDGVDAAGIKVNSSTKVEIVDSTVRDNGIGVLLMNGATATISRSHFLGNSNAGVWARPTTAASSVTAYVSESVMNGNGYGVVASSATGTTRVYVTKSVANGNSFDGFENSSYSGGTDVIMVVDGSSATGNARYGFANFTGTFKSTGNNVVTGNAGGDTNGGTITPLGGT